ncbi:MAG: 5-bromo-4-chloroindolyl phosphate hydrolysis family protein [Bacilli bacterium]|nr:5-bromo-4-chloroindolyl phosphate hydrolysis family protein [Bacilli bacterium]
MRNKEVVSAIVGSAFFAIPYLGLSVALAPALVIGGVAFGASELVLSGVKEKETLKDTDRELYKKVQKAKEQNREILNLIPKVESPETKKNLTEIYETVVKIINTIQFNPKKAKKIPNFFDYYLPVLIKIVTKYDEVENQKLKSEEGKEFLVKADKMIKDTNKAFSNILASLFQSDIIDVDADMKVYDLMLKADGITGDEIMKGSDDNEE